MSLQGGPDGWPYHLRCRGRVEEFPPREKSDGWTGHHDHYQEPGAGQLEDDGRHRHHLDMSYIDLVVNKFVCC